MKKLKLLAIAFFLTAGLLSCEAEKVGQDVGNENFQGTQIFRYDIDGRTRVTSNVDVSSSGNSILIKATFNDELSDYNSEVLSISLDKLATGTYISAGSNLTGNQIYNFSSASFKFHNVNWYYSTQNVLAYLNANNLNFQTGNLDIMSINDKAKYFEGRFEYDLYAPYSENPNSTIQPLRIRNGYFQYVKYE